MSFPPGAQTVPFFEYHGLPAMLVKQSKKNSSAQSQATPPQAPASQSQSLPPAPEPPLAAPPQLGTDAELPLDPQVAGQCGGPAPCP